MAYDDIQYRAFYRKLLSLYPRGFREQLGESMEQTFNDLCRERKDAGKGLFGFALWTYTDTLLGIINEEIKYMKPIFKKHGSIIISIIGAVAIIVTSWLAKDTEYNDTAWLIAFCIWLVLYSAFEAYSNIKKDKDQ